MSFHQTEPVGHGQPKSHYFVGGKGGAMRNWPSQRVQAGHDLFDRFAAVEQPAEDVPIGRDYDSQFSKSCVIQFIRGAAGDTRVNFFLNSISDLRLDVGRYSI